MSLCLCTTPDSSLSTAIRVCEADRHRNMQFMSFTAHIQPSLCYACSCHDLMHFAAQHAGHSAKRHMSRVQAGAATTTTFTGNLHVQANWHNIPAQHDVAPVTCIAEGTEQRSQQHSVHACCQHMICFNAAHGTCLRQKAATTIP